MCEQKKTSPGVVGVEEGIGILPLLFFVICSFTVSGHS
jgi:hypothetical protein